MDRRRCLDVSKKQEDGQSLLFNYTRIKIIRCKAVRKKLRKNEQHDEGDENARKDGEDKKGFANLICKKRIWSSKEDSYSNSMKNAFTVDEVRREKLSEIFNK